ncbi:MAG: TIGR03960 family B12-binding radical SAM protein [Chitinispirillaceae bacterium]
MREFRTAVETDFLPFVEKPLRYIGNEINIIRKDIQQCTCRAVFCFPDLYDLGMSHYGSQILYHIVNSRSQWALSRCYHPAPDAEVRMRQAGLLLWDLEYTAPIQQADWVGFSVQYELQYTNILNMLDLAGIALRSRDRAEHEPLIIAGGPCMINPEPLAPFMDLCVVGDGEESIVNICTVIERKRRFGWSREHTLGELAKIDGVYVPSITPVSRRGRFMVPGEDHLPSRAAKVSELDSRYYPDKPLVPVINVVHDRLAVEVMRGCTRGCRYCSAGMYYRPVRERQAGDLFMQIREGVKNTGLREIGLLSLSTADYSGLTPLLNTADQLRHESRLSISLPSTRIDALDAKQMHLLNRAVPASSMTIAPEAGSQRLRDIINKDFTEEAIIDAVEKLLQNNIQTLKLYFMIGLPGEEGADIEELIALVRRIGDMARKRGRRRTVNVSISPFSPKPHTPFQWEGMESPETLLQKSRHIKFSLKNMRNVRVSYRDPQITLLESVMARGDRAVADIIERAWSKGARFDGWDEHFDINRWRESAADLDCSFDTYTESISQDQKLPWSTISLGIDESFLWEEKEKAQRAETTVDCRGSECTACGVCDIVPQQILKHHCDLPQSGKLYKPERATLRTAAKPFYYRLSYKKTDQARFLAHRDMINAIERAFTMCAVPLAYSEGFHPHPRLSFGPPLSLGVAGEREMMDAVLIREFEWEFGAINRWLPSGLRITGVARLGAKPVSLNADIVAGEYVLRVPDTIDTAPLEIVKQALDKETLVVQTTKKGQTIDKDIRPLIHTITSSPTDPREISCVVSMLPGNTCRVDELVSALFPGYSAAQGYVRRDGFFRSENEQLRRMVEGGE